jgi:hypothetical protein
MILNSCQNKKITNIFNGIASRKERLSFNASSSTDVNDDVNQMLYF